MKNTIYAFLFLLVSPLVWAQTEANITKENYTVTGITTLSATRSITIKPTSWIKSGSTFTARIVKAPDATTATDAYTPITPSNENYVLTRSFLQPTDNFNPATAKEGDVIEQITYFDGLGRPMQQVNIKGAPNKSDIVTHIGYDGFGRQDKDWLPYTETSGGKGSYRGDVRTNTQQYYNTQYANDFTGMALADINAYSQKAFEASPLNRIQQQAAPGKDWKLGTDHEIAFDYQTNIEDEVRHFDVTTAFTNNTYTPTITTTGFYNAGELYKTVTKDENYDPTKPNLHTTEEFKDKQGRVVLKRTYANTSGTSGAHDTYYVYDDYGNLTYVLPPKAEAQTGLPTATILSELCYQYIYDYRNRLVEKKIPGKGKEHIVYDTLDRPILTQDQNQRNKTTKQWLFTKYDAFGRVAYTGIWTSNSPRSTIQDIVSNLPAEKLYENKISPVVFGGATIAYTNKAYPDTKSVTLHTINYYDDYSFNGFANLPSSYQGQTIINHNNTNKIATKGLATANMVRVLDSNPVWITTVTGYDAKGRPIYIKSNNTYLKTTDVITNKLSFAGIVEKTATSHTKTGQAVITTEDVFVYDHQNRLLKQKQTINNQDQETIVANTYDNLGQLISKGVGGKSTNANRLQSVDYTYNVRGWLKGINDNVNTDNTLTIANNDLFGFKINYNNPQQAPHYTTVI